MNDALEKLAQYVPGLVNNLARICSRCTARRMRLCGLFSLWQNNAISLKTLVFFIYIYTH